ncbi:MAG: hypothetical protein KIS87_04600 [Phycisphaeraceae bacterium]|nr:hypothetical protein [Phycisphaeraceae bacterium]
MRIVSLVPSATESLCLVGGRGMLVGRSHECDFPDGLEDLPTLTAARTVGGDAAAIDAEVRQELAGGRSLYTINEAEIERLQPDLILTQDVCSVCSIDLETVRRLVERMTPRPQVLSLNPTTVEDVLDDVLAVGEAAGLASGAREAVLRLRERLFRAQEYVPPYVDGPVVGFLEWTDPLFIAGHWTVQLIERAGGRHPLNPTVACEDAGAAEGPQQAERAAGRSIAVPAEVFAGARPEWLVVCPCGLGLERAWEETTRLARAERFRTLPAVRAGRVAVVDGNQMFNRPGPRLVDAFEWLVGWLQDRRELIPPGFPWRAWA